MSISKKENCKDLGKKQDRFQETGKIVDICGHDSYIVEDLSGRIVNRSHAHLKAMEKTVYWDVSLAGEVGLSQSPLLIPLNK